MLARRESRSGLKNRRQRERERAGVVVLRVEADEHKLALALLLSGRLNGSIPITAR